MKKIVLQERTDEELDAIREAVKAYHKRLNSTAFAFHADTYGHKEMALHEANNTLSKIEEILKLDTL